MKRFFILSSAVLLSISASAQIPEDALKFSWNAPGGTARNQGIGGAMGSLGGDLSTLFVNPAGLGFYKTGEFVISPGFSFLNSKSNFRGSANSAKDNGFNLGTSGFVFGSGNNRGNWAGTAFGVAVTRSANFNNQVFYKGNNDFSSFSEQYALELSESNVSIDNVFSSNLSLPTKMAVYTYLIDTFRAAGGGLEVRGRPEFLALRDQQNRITTTGGITEIAMGFAANKGDKFYIGGSVGLPIVNYERRTEYIETDATGNTDNDFAFSRYEETYKTKGLGLNAKLGLIVKPVEQVRLGLAIHTPTIYGLTDQVTAKMVTDVEKLFGPNDAGVDSIGSDYYYGNKPGEFKYDMTSPWRIMLSGSYVLRETQDVSQQRGFLTADIEYVNYRSNRYSTAEEVDDDSYYEGVNKGVKEYYKGTFNFRAGGELKFTTIMARLGFAYYGNPYKDKELKGRKIFLSGGLGYRNKGYFVDLAYVLGLTRDASFPYRLADKQNTFAALKNNSSNIALTVGLKF
ncbi:MAG: hypothetical protein H7Y27_08740 [Gemmatimonadaceae bacterium]|nr:hypothetical protein [Chitinophagaceae bacterium]